MEIVRSIEVVSFNRESVITVGTFDGVHQAHRQIIDEVRARAVERSGRSVVVTFDPHPKEVVAERRRRETGIPGAPVRLLTTTDEKLALLSELGVDLIVVLPFTEAFSRKSFREFYRDDIVRRIGVSEVIEGYDHAFGHDREGGPAQLVELGKEFGFSVVAEKPIVVGGVVVSSSNIRTLIERGSVREANLLLGRRYGFSGTVVKGDGRGRGLGFPTANLALRDPRKLLPANGIYAVSVLAGSGRHEGLMSIGTLPTFFDHHERSCEVHLLDVERDLYGSTLTVECLEWIREERKFDSPADLVRAMEKDRETGRKIFSRTASR